MRHRTKSPFLLITLILMTVCLFLFSAMKLFESALLPPSVESTLPASRTLIRDGVEYYPRQDMTVILLIGTDTDGIIQESGSYNNKASADMVSLLIFDESIQEFFILALNRDTMMNIPVLGLNGKPAGSVFAQLAISHNYGSGLQDSCENTRKAVSDFLYGLTINYYVSMNMDGISILNDRVGGVEVFVEDDFSVIDPSLKQGSTMVLNGGQAYNFVRSRGGVGSQLNISRMERQQVYMNGFISSLKRTMENEEYFFADLWTSLSDYIVSDCSVAVLNRLASDYGEYTFSGSITLEGENVLGDKYFEFYADTELLDELIIDRLYSRKP